MWSITFSQLSLASERVHEAVAEFGSFLALAGLALMIVLKNSPYVVLLVFAASV